MKLQNQKKNNIQKIYNTIKTHLLVTQQLMLHK